MKTETEKTEVYLKYELSKMMVKEIERFDNLRKDDEYEDMNMQSLIFLQRLLTERMSRLNLGNYKKTSEDT
jgi:hypothetical protein